MQRISIELFVAAGIGVLIAFLGPLGAYPSAPGKLMFYWISLIIIGYAIFRPLLIISKWLHEVTRIPLWTAQGLAIGLASLPVMLLVSTTLNGFDYSMLSLNWMIQMDCMFIEVDG